MPITSPRCQRSYGHAHHRALLPWDISVGLTLQTKPALLYILPCWQSLLLHAPSKGREKQQTAAFLRMKATCQNQIISAYQLPGNKPPNLEHPFPPSQSPGSIYNPYTTSLMWASKRGVTPRAMSQVSSCKPGFG